MMTEGKVGSLRTVVLDSPDPPEPAGSMPGCSAPN